MRAVRRASPPRHVVGVRGSGPATAMTLSSIWPTKRGGEAEIAVTALFLGGQQAGVGEAGEVAAGGLRRDVGGECQFLGGERASVQQGGQDVGAGRITEQGGDGGHACGVAHGGEDTPGWREAHGGMVRRWPKCWAERRTLDPFLGGGVRAAALFDEPVARSRLFAY